MFCCCCIDLKVPLTHEFASEAPGRDGHFQKLMLQLNLAPRRIFDDMLVTASIRQSYLDLVIVDGVCQVVQYESPDKNRWQMQTLTLRTRPRADLARWECAG